MIVIICSDSKLQMGLATGYINWNHLPYLALELKLQMPEQNPTGIMNHGS